MTIGPYGHRSWFTDPLEESIGPLLTRLRLARGQSQLRLAQTLCAASGTTTVTRHEVSRWERGDRIPSAQWLGWLAAALDVPQERLAAVAARTRGVGEPADSERAALVLAAGCRSLRAAGAPPTDHAVLSSRIAALRRMDDLVGGCDLADLVLSEWHAAVRAFADRPPDPNAPTRGWPEPATVRAAVTAATVSHSPAHALALGELAQLASWVLADADRHIAARNVGRAGLFAAHAAQNAPLLSHILGCLAESAAEAGDTGAALRLASAATNRAARTHPAARALSLYRFAYVAALAGSRVDAAAALTAAEHTCWSSVPSDDLPWLYWLTEPHLVALTGRCYAALGRPRLARSLLAEAIGTGALRPRTHALCAAWLGLATAQTNDLNRACEAGAQALVEAIRSGSLRATRWVRTLDATLRRDLRRPVVRQYTALTTWATAYLPDVPHPMHDVRYTVAEPNHAPDSAHDTATD